jgi:hypothetical protein
MDTQSNFAQEPFNMSRITHSQVEAAYYTGCSTRSIRRWKNRHIPYHKSGERERSGSVGFDQLLLVICLFIYPCAEADEICAFIVANGGDVYSRQQITERTQELVEMARKRASKKEAYAAFSPIVQVKVKIFFTYDFPHGIRNVVLANLKDQDETGFVMSRLGKGYDKSHRCMRIRDTAYYVRKDPQTFLLMSTVQSKMQGGGF